MTRSDTLRAYPVFLLAAALGSATAAMTAAAAELQVSITDDEGNPLHNAVIEITSPSLPIPEDWNYNAIMDQVDKEFVRDTITVVRGSVVEFPNSDDILHHVYSFSGDLAFELPLYMGDDADPVQFDHPGVAVLGCNIHDWMIGYVYVGESHLMALSDENGVARLADLPPGDYTFRIWHPRASEAALTARHEVGVQSQGVTAIDLNIALAPDQRIRRAPARAGRGYRGR